MKTVKALDREQWRLLRLGYITASDAAVICGASPWKSELELFYEKQGMAIDAEENEAMRWGNILEPVICDEVGKRLGCLVEHWPQDTIVVNLDNDWQSCTPDATIDGGQRILQVKTTSSYNADYAEQLPLHYEVQVQHELLVTKAEAAVVAILIGGQKLVLKDVEPNPDFAEWLTHKEAQFRKRLAEFNPPTPDGSESARRTLNKLFGDKHPEPLVLDGDLGVDAMDADGHLQEVKKAITDLQAKKEILEQELLQLMNGREAVLLPSGVKYTYLETTRAGYTVGPSTYRSFRRSKSK
jgi:putative phage-type endonuclease